MSIKSLIEVSCRYEKECRDFNCWTGGKCESCNNNESNKPRHSYYKRTSLRVELFVILFLILFFYSLSK